MYSALSTSTEMSKREASLTPILDLAPHWAASQQQTLDQHRLHEPVCQLPYDAALHNVPKLGEINKLSSIDTLLLLIKDKKLETN